MGQSRVCALGFGIQKSSRCNYFGGWSLGLSWLVHGVSQGAHGVRGCSLAGRRRKSDVDVLYRGIPSPCPRKDRAALKNKPIVPTATLAKTRTPKPHMTTTLVDYIPQIPLKEGRIPAFEFSPGALSIALQQQATIAQAFRCNQTPNPCLQDQGLGKQLGSNCKLDCTVYAAYPVYTRCMDPRQAPKYQTKTNPTKSLQPPL